MPPNTRTKSKSSCLPRWRTWPRPIRPPKLVLTVTASFRLGSGTARPLGTGWQAKDAAVEPIEAREMVESHHVGDLADRFAAAQHQSSGVVEAQPVQEIGERAAGFNAETAVQNLPCSSRPTAMPR